MKQIGIILAVAFLVGCSTVGEKKYNLTGKDTFAVAWHYRTNDSGWDIKMAHDSLGKVWAYGDSASSEGKYKTSTIWKFFTYVDTLRDGAGKPIYDSVRKQYKSRWEWVLPAENIRSTIEVTILKKLNK